MIVLGLLILLVVAVVAVTAIARGGASVSIDLGSITVKTDAAGMFITGAVTLVFAVIGLWLLRRGFRRSQQRRREVKELRHRASRTEDDAGRAPANAGSAERANGRDDGRSGRPPDADDHFDSAPRER
jgi:uncharacterized protein HemY